MQYSKQDLQDLLDKYEADNLTELAGKLLDAAYKESPALNDMHTLSSAMWVVEHPCYEEIQEHSKGKGTILSYMWYMWGVKEHTVTLDSEEHNTQWDKDTRFTSLESALNGMEQ